MDSLSQLTAPEMRPGHDLLANGKALARDWSLGTNAFLEAEGVASEEAYKRREAATGRIMQHAHIGFRNIDRTVDAMAELHEAAIARGVRIDRFGITLDWTMGYPPDRRKGSTLGTGIVLTGPQDFIRITNACPAAAHFGDFMLGLPGALHNTQAAIVAGATAIGNLGQYFTFRLPYWDDDVATTEATVTALGLISAQEADILVHSNLDDGFAGLFLDMASALGMVVIEKYIIEDLIGAHASFCFGHHFSDPLSRSAFHAAVAQLTDTPGTMLFGNTVAYRGTPAANYASLASYLLADIAALGRRHTGHAINPVPVTENLRIPDIEEILDAQVFAARLVEHAPAYRAIMNQTVIDALATKLLDGARAFAARTMEGLAARGVDVSDPAALMLAIRRLGARRMEMLFSAKVEGSRPVPLVPADWAQELDEMARRWVAAQRKLPDYLSCLTVALGTTDVHEHGAYLVRSALERLGPKVVDAGTAVDAEVLVDRALAGGANAVAISTYNGVGLSYTRAVIAALEARGVYLPVLVGGKLNEIPADSNSSLPVDVSDEIRRVGAYPCTTLDDMLEVLSGLCQSKSA